MRKREGVKVKLLYEAAGEFSSIHGPEVGRGSALPPSCFPQRRKSGMKDSLTSTWTLYKPEALYLLAWFSSTVSTFIFTTLYPKTHCPVYCVHYYLYLVAWLNGPIMLNRCVLFRIVCIIWNIGCGHTSIAIFVSMAKMRTQSRQLFGLLETCCL